LNKDFYIITSMAGTPGSGVQWRPLPPPEIFRVTYKIGSLLHKADLGYSATIRQSLYLTSHIEGI